VKPKHQRLILICSVLIGLGVSISLMLMAFKDTLVFFYTPSDLSHKKISGQQLIRIGGVVENQSLRQSGEKVCFKVADQNAAITISYHGILPDLFKEGQGVVVEGYLQDPQNFRATTVLAKHDEQYMPKEVADQLKATGRWRHVQ